MPMTPFIGVRISWLMLARNSLLAELASSACSVFSVASAIAAWRRRFGEGDLRIGPLARGDVARDPEGPDDLPVRRRHCGSLVVDTQVSWPSGHVSFSSRPTTGMPERMIRCSSS